MDRIPEAVARAWRGHVCHPGRAGRFLSPLGSGISAEAPAMANQDLDAFLSALGRTRGDDPVLLAETLDLARPAFSAFFSELLPGLLDSLANERVAEEAVVGPALRGRPDWGRTFLGRRTGALAATDFLSRLPERSFALPENQLVRWLIGSVGDGLSRVAARTGGPMPPALGALRAQVSETLAHPWIGKVEPPTRLDGRMLACAGMQRIPGYREAAELAASRDRLDGEVAEVRRLAVLDLLRANWLAPVNPDDLFELFVLVRVLDALVEVLGPPSEYGLVTAGRRHVARFPGAGDVRVLFDQKPPGEDSSRRYSQIRARHEGLPASPRRPDILLLRQDPPRALMVEVKRTSDASYISDSIYKGFGYLSDFEDLWANRPGNPRLVIVLPGNDVRPKLGSPLGGGSLVLCGPDHPGALAEVVRVGLGL